jgi:hypothetical protein
VIAVDVLEPKTRDEWAADGFPNVVPVRWLDEGEYVQAAGVLYTAPIGVVIDNWPGYTDVDAPIWEIMSAIDVLAAPPEFDPAVADLTFDEVKELAGQMLIEAQLVEIWGETSEAVETFRASIADGWTAQKAFRRMFPAVDNVCPACGHASYFKRCGKCGAERP